MGRHFEVRAASMAKTAAKKSKIYSRYGKEIYIAAKNGVADPEMNIELKRVIAQAKSNQVPADVIKRAIEKAKGGTGEDYSSARYEGFGPGAATIIIDCLTDNANRTIGDIRTCFNKTHFKLGQNGSVSFLYHECGYFVFDYSNDEEILEALLMADIDVIDLENEEGTLYLQVPFEKFHEAREVLDGILGEDFEYKVVETTMLPIDDGTEIEDADEKAQFIRLIDLLEDLDDVQKVYHNVNNLDA